MYLNKDFKINNLAKLYYENESINKIGGLYLGETANSRTRSLSTIKRQQRL